MATSVAIKAEAPVDFPPLSPLEWKVVSLAMREAGEAGRAGHRQGWLPRLLGTAMGPRPKLPLADPRLETLRRFVCRVRDRSDLSEIKPRLIELGFHPGQISAVAMLAR